MAKRIAGIYRIRCKVTGDCYIGQSRDIHLRWVSHKNELRKGEHLSERLQADWNKYGEDAFEFSIVETLSPYEPIPHVPGSYVSPRPLLAREGYYLRLERPAYNSRIP